MARTEARKLHCPELPLGLVTLQQLADTAPCLPCPHTSSIPLPPDPVSEHHHTNPLGKHKGKASRRSLMGTWCRWRYPTPPELLLSLFSKTQTLPCLQESAGPSYGKHWRGQGRAGQSRQKGVESRLPAQFSPPKVSHSPKPADLSDKYNSCLRDFIPE